MKIIALWSLQTPGRVSFTTDLCCQFQSFMFEFNVKFIQLSNTHVLKIKICYKMCVSMKFLFGFLQGTLYKPVLFYI